MNVLRAASLYLRIMLLALLIFLSPAAFSASDTYVPPPGKTLLIVGQDRDTISGYVAYVGDVPGGVMLYTSVQEARGLNSPADYGSGPQDGNALLQAYPYSVIQVGLYMVDGLEKTAAGKYDANLKTLAGWIKKASRPVYVRIGYEFDNPSNHYDPNQYVEAFRYVVDFLRKQGADNAAFVWHTQCAQDSGLWLAWYPGDEYVDWFGVSLFSTGQIPVAKKFLEMAEEHKKPFMICESSPWGIYTLRGKIDWFTHVFNFIREEKVRAFCYINSNWDAMPMYRGQSIGDARLEENDEIKKIWLKETGQSRYLKASPGLY